MATELALAIRLTATDTGLKATVAGVGRSFEEMGLTAQKAGDQATAALTRTRSEIELTTASAGRLTQSVGTTGAGFQKFETNVNALRRAVNDASGALALFGLQGTAVDGALRVVARTLSGVADVAGSLGQVFSGGGGIFGTLARVAGVVGIATAAVGGLIAALNALRGSSDRAREAQDAYFQAIQRSNEALGLTRNLAEERRLQQVQEAIATTQAAIAIERETMAMANNAAARSQRAQSRLEEAIAEGRAPPDSAGRGLDRVRQRGEGIAGIAEAAGQRLIDLQGRLAQLETLARGRDLGQGQFGPPVPGAPRRERAGAAPREERDLDPFRNFREAAIRLEAQTRTPLEVYQARIRELNDLVTVGGLGQETYSRAVDDAARKLEQASGAAGEAGTGIESLDRAFDRLNESIAGTGRETADYLAKAALGIDQVKFSFEQLAQKLGSGILSRLIQDEITGPLSKALVQMARAGITSLIGTGIGSNTVAGGTSVADLSRLGPALPAPALHTGGIAGREAPMGLRAMPAALFAGAPKFHSGGMVGPGEVPAILKRGEGVFTPGQMAAMGGSTTVNVIDQRSAGAPQAETSQRSDGNGGTVIDVLIRDTVKRGLADGSFDSTLRAGFGIQRRGA